VTGFVAVDLLLFRMRTILSGEPHVRERAWRGVNGGEPSCFLQSVMSI
jgi:hypothetical protein